MSPRVGPADATLKRSALYAAAIRKQLDEDPVAGLHATAALIRERARSASASHDGALEVWRVEPHETDATLAVVATTMNGRPDEGATDGDVLDPTEVGSAVHIAGWDPATATAVAALLVVAPDSGTSSLVFHAAREVARTYLGGLQ